jgi:hypothetical protein
MKRKVSGYLFIDSSRNVIVYKKSLPSIVNYTPYSRIYSNLKPLKLIIVRSSASFNRLNSLTSLNTNVNTDPVVNKTLQSDYFCPNHNSTSKKLFFKIPPLNLAEQSRQTFEFSGSCFPFLRHFKSEKHLIIQNPF